MSSKLSGWIPNPIKSTDYKIILNWKSGWSFMYQNLDSFKEWERYRHLWLQRNFFFTHSDLNDLRLEKTWIVKKRVGDFSPSQDTAPSKTNSLVTIAITHFILKYHIIFFLTNKLQRKKRRKGEKKTCCVPMNWHVLIL